MVRGLSLMMFLKVSTTKQHNEYIEQRLVTQISRCYRDNKKQALA